MLIAIWTLAVLGIWLTIAKGNIPRLITSIIYLGMGWLAVFAIVPLQRCLSAAGFFWLVAGGILYSVGGVLYALKWPGRDNPRFGCHEIFHVFIVLGSVAHFLVMTGL
jgi:hemolysin III